VRAAFGLVLATAASLVLAQQAPKPAPKAQKSQKVQKAHAKPSPEQVRRFNELQKKERGKR
jgi:hypothetical protein